MLVTRKLGRPVKWTESRSEGNLTVHHGRDQWQRIRIAADSDGRMRGLDVDLLADMGAYLMLVTPGVPLLGAFMYPAIYKMDALLVQVHRRLHHEDAHRRLPRRRAARGHVRDRADHGRARRRAGRGPAGGARAELDQARGVPVHHDRRPDVRLGQLRGGHGPGQGAVRLRRAAAGADRADRAGTTRSGSASASRRSPRCAAWRRPGCSARCPTAPAAGRAPRSGCCPPARSRWSPGPARTARATRRPGARSWPTSSACRSRTSGCCTVTPRSRPRAWTPTGRARWPWAAWPWSAPATR